MNSERAPATNGEANKYKKPNSIFVYFVYLLEMKKRYIQFISLIFIFQMCTFCSNEKYTPEEMSIDPAFLKVFNAISKDKILVFTNADREKAFEISEPDSIIHDKKGGFMAGGPYKDLIININETGTDTLELDRPNEIFVHRDPEKDNNGI